MTTAAKYETTSAPPPVLLQTRVRGVAPKTATAIGLESSVSSTLRWGSWQVYDGTASARLVGLDYFGARYMSSAQGRFTGPDPLDWLSWQSGNDGDKERFQAFISDPQGMNKYAYARNNPLKYVDPTGEDFELAVTFNGDPTDEEKARILGAIRQYLTNLKIGNVVVRDAAVKSDDKRTWGQTFKDFFNKDYQTLKIDFTSNVF